MKRTSAKREARRWAAALGLMAAGTATALPATENPFGQPGDGGAAAYSPGVPAAALPPASAEAAARFPLAQTARIHVLGGAVRGLGVLAEYGPDGPGQVMVTRVTRAGGREPYAPVALARVYDPQGNLAAIGEFTDQKDGADRRVLDLGGKGGAGIWRVSFSGGRSGDLVEIRLPATPFWGVRGESSLGVTATTPRPAYVWIAPSSIRLLVGIETGQPNGIQLADAEGRTVLARVEPDPLKRAGRLVLQAPPAGKVCRLTLPEAFSGALVIEGTAPLLCPTPEAAARLQGGAVEARGLWTASPIQARAREWMVANGPKVNRSLSFELPKEIPPGLANLEYHVLGFSKYGPLNSLKALLDVQNRNLDPSLPGFGSCLEKPQTESWPQFLSASTQAFTPAALGTVATFDSPLNPAYRNDDLILRATLAGLYQVVSMSYDNLLREPKSSFFLSRYPMENAFLAYAGMTEAYLNLRELAAPDARDIWREGMMAVGDKLADYQSYESNQWAHVFSGHLNIYRATGEKRFLRYFERAATAYLDNAFGPDSKYGQHPAGFFLEDFGADGNYDNLNSFYLVDDYLEYRRLPEADPELVEKMRAGIERNLAFRSLFWLPQPDGAVVAPNAFNCRTEGDIAGTGYPGPLMARGDFPLGAARFALTARPRKGIGSAATFSYVANTPEWVRATLEDGLKKGAGAYDNTGYSWLPILERAYALPRKAAPAPLPVDETDKTWTLPGLLAWNRGGLYGLAFYDVAGTTQELKGFMGGGPTALWTRATGSFLAGGAPRHPAPGPLPNAESLTFSCVYGEDGSGNFYYSGQERTSLKAAAEGTAYETSARIRRPGGTLRWRYEPVRDGLQLSVQWSPAAACRTQYLNLPLAQGRDGVAAALSAPGQLTVAAPQGSVRVEWPSNAPGKLEKSAREDTARLVIPLPSDGSTLALRVTVLSPPGEGSPAPAK